MILRLIPWVLSSFVSDLALSETDSSTLATGLTNFLAKAYKIWVVKAGFALRDLLLKIELDLDVLKLKNLAYTGGLNPDFCILSLLFGVRDNMPFPK